MAKERYTRTNQKMLFAGLALEAWREHESTGAYNVLAQVQADREAALFHLYGAVLGLCHEVAGYYRLSLLAGSSVEMYLDAARKQIEPNPELAELMEIAQEPSAWLAQLLTAYAQLFEPPREERKTKVDPSTPLITAVMVEDESAPVSVDEMETWRQSLKALILRFREGLSEC